MTTDTVGGVWTFCVELIRQLSGHDIAVTLAALGGEPSAAQRADLDGVPGLELITSNYHLEWMDDPWRDVEASGQWLLDIERRVNPDLVHLNSFAHGALSWRTPVLLGAHSCVLSWWEAVRREPAPPSWERYVDCVTKSLRAVNLVVTPTQALLDALRAHYGSPGAACVVPNGRDAARFQAGSKEPLVLAAGRLWDEAKNIAAVARLAEEISWPIYAAGEERSPDGRVFEPGTLKLLGALPSAKLAGWMARASIFVSPARYEPFGLSILEAGLSGCALVLGDIPSLREVWPDDSAVFVDPGDSEAFTRVVQRLIDDPDHCREQGQRARTQALEYSSARMGDHYLELYQVLTTPEPPLPAPSL